MLLKQKRIKHLIDDYDGDTNEKENETNEDVHIPTQTKSRNKLVSMITTSSSSVVILA